MNTLRKRVTMAKFLDDEVAVARLLQSPPYDETTARRIEMQAADLVRAARDSDRSKPMLDTFLSEYGLSNSEGVALMCLAESLLRVPDWETADLLIADKLTSGDWEGHAGNAESLLVNASTWALMLTGRLVELDDDLLAAPVSWFKRLVTRVSEPVIQAAIRTAMEILGREFVLGQTIEKAIGNSAEDGLYSFDMLGEAARDAATAARYLSAYQHAIDTVAAGGVSASVSIKLSALHPRYEAAQRGRVLKELVATVADLCERAARNNIQVTIDAEEADRLELSLDVLEALVIRHHVRNLGFVVQAYGKRAPDVLDWLIALAGAHDMVIPVRLVKGAYWDAEIKHAQVEGYPGFPVYTRKPVTDLAYLVCARKILDHPGQLFGQFATHNAHTIVALMEMGRGFHFEFQRLHGMGELLFATAAAELPGFPSVRTYAPVGAHEDLLAYLVRRLLENGANSSFVNRFLDAGVEPAQLVPDPVAQVMAFAQQRHPDIPLPAALFPGRVNSAGLDLSDPAVTRDLETAVRAGRTGMPQVAPVSEPDIDAAVARASAAQPAWDRQGPLYRAEVLRRMADLLQQHQQQLIACLVNEAGKTIADAMNEVREAIDFCRYYAAEVSQFAGPLVLPGPTGESNQLTWQGRGVWVCISPWNFPLAIFVGQVAAALAMGNAVIAKPAEQTPQIAGRCVALLFEAGVPHAICQLLAGDGVLGQRLVEHPGIAGVAFTGGTATARRINIAMANADRPIVPLVAETGGQNAMLVDSTALLEQVVDDVVDSAFRSAGQRCSALRVLYLQDDIYDKAVALIVGAMNELRVGDPGRVATDVGPVITASAADELNAHIRDMRARGWVRHQVTLCDDKATGSFALPTLVEIPDLAVLTREHFGPILHVIRFRASDMETVLEQINQTGYGLTFGIHTRINARSHEVSRRVTAGNIYVNRNITGAVVGSQPFGGQGYSGTGPKAGGPHYLQRFAVERVVTINTVASGGNAELLNLNSAETAGQSETR